MNFPINEVRQPFSESVKLIRHFLSTIGHPLFHFRQLCSMTQSVPEFHFSCFCSVTKFMQPLGQGNNMLPDLFICAHSTLDVPVVLWSTHKNSSVTKKCSNRLGVRWGEQVPLLAHQLPQGSPSAVWIPHCFHWPLKPHLSRPSRFALELVADSFFRSF